MNGGALRRIGVVEGGVGGRRAGLTVGLLGVRTIMGCRLLVAVWVRTPLSLLWLS